MNQSGISPEVPSFLDLGVLVRRRWILLLVGALLLPAIAQTRKMMQPTRFGLEVILTRAGRGSMNNFILVPLAEEKVRLQLQGLLQQPPTTDGSRLVDFRVLTEDSGLVVDLILESPEEKAARDFAQKIRATLDALTEKEYSEARHILDRETENLRSRSKLLQESSNSFAENKPGRSESDRTASKILNQLVENSLRELNEDQALHELRHASIQSSRYREASVIPLQPSARLGTGALVFLAAVGACLALLVAIFLEWRRS